MLSQLTINGKTHYFTRTDFDSESRMFPSTLARLLNRGFTDLEVINLLNASDVRYCEDFVPPPGGWDEQIQDKEEKEYV